MKNFFLRFLPAFLIACLVAAPGLQASHMSFTDGLLNLNTVEDSKTYSSIYGRFDMDDGYDKFSVAYRLNMNSINDVDGSSDNSFSRLGLYIKVFNHNAASDEGVPFQELVIQLNGEVKLINYNDLYFRLSDVSISAQQPTEIFALDTADIKDMLAYFEDTWFYINLGELNDTTYGQDIPAEVYKEWEAQLQGDPRDFLTSAFEYGVRQEAADMMTEEEIQSILGAFESFLTTQFFNIREVISGPNTGFDFFYLNRVKLAGWIENLANELGNPMPDADIAQMREDLGKITLSGIYRVNEVSGLLDNFLLRFKLREVEGLDNLEVNYRVKLADVNKDNVINAPTVYEDFQTFMEGIM